MKLSDVSAASLVMKLVHILRHQMAAAPKQKYNVKYNLGVLWIRILRIRMFLGIRIRAR
jgi:hypothetical protein